MFRLCDMKILTPARQVSDSLETEVKLHFYERKLIIIKLLEHETHHSQGQLV